MNTNRLLAIDIGNSFTHFGLFHQKHLIMEIRLPTLSPIRKSSFPLEYFINASQAIIIASVVSKKEEELKNFLRSCYRKKVYSLKDGLSTGLTIDYELPLGEDRICAASGVAFHYKKNGIIVDLGTATTFSCVTKEGKFFGGAIAPGITSSLTFLEKANLLRPFAPLFSQQLMRSDIQPPYIAKNTRDCLKNGIYLYTKYAIEGIIKRLKSEIKRKEVSVFLTGGHSFVYKYILSGINIIDPFLNLRGLCEIYYLNRR